MPYYALPGSQAALTTTYKTAAAVWAQSSVQLRRGKIMELLFGPTSVPAGTDTSIQYDVSRMTALGTVTAFTPNPLDPADAAACAGAGISASAEPTVTANSSLFNQGVGQRASVQWAALDEAKALIYPATLNNGLVLRVLSPANYTGGVSAQANFVE